MESMTHQLQEKKKLIEDVSDSINNGYVFIYTTKFKNVCQECKIYTKVDGSHL